MHKTYTNCHLDMIHRLWVSQPLWWFIIMSTITMMSTSSFNNVLKREYSPTNNKISVIVLKVPLHNILLCCPCLDIKTHSSVCLSVRPSVHLSVTKTLTWLISSEVLMIEHWYLACMILVTGPFYWYHAVTLTFDQLQGQICLLIPCGDLDLDLWPTSRSNLLPGGGPQFFAFAC